MSDIIGKINELKAKEYVIDTARIRNVAIVFMDLSGSTKYKHDHNFVEGYRKTRFHNELIKHVVTMHSGLVIKEIGDEVLAIFDDCCKASECVIEIQEAFKRYNDLISTTNDKIFSKMGVHFGRILIENGDIFGSAVDFASRVANLSVDGQIVISEHVKNLIGNEFHTSIPYTIELKGLGEQIVYELMYDQLRGIRSNDVIISSIYSKIVSLEMLLINNAINKVNGIVAIHNDQDIVQRTLSELQKRVVEPRDVCIMAISGMKIWTNNNFVEFIRKSKANLRILLLSPTSKHIGQRAEEYHNYTKTTLRKEIEVALAKLQMLKGLSETRIELKLYESPPVFRLVKIDNEMFIGGYLGGVSSTKTVLYQITTGDSSLYYYFDKYFNAIWKEAKCAKD